MKKRAIIDLDDTIVSLIPDLVHQCNELTGIYRSVSDWKTYDTVKLYGIDEKQYWQMCIENKLLEHALPVGRAKKSIDILIDQGFDIHYLTARGWHPKGKQVTKEWLKKWNFA